MRRILLLLLMFFIFVQARKHQIINDYGTLDFFQEQMGGTICDTHDGKFSAGDTAFLFFATTIVMMQTPASGIAQAGLIRQKNTLSMLTQIMTGTQIGSILWYTIGFGMTYGTSYYGFIGSPFQYFALFNVPLNDCFPGQTIPALLYVGYEMMFALMTPLIMSGAWAERLTFRAFIPIMIIWPILIYYPVAHWAWNHNGWLHKLGFLDFSGGIVIHTTSGVGALVISLFLDKRKKTFGIDKAHNITLAVIGTVIVWAGWYSFNGGSALRANQQAVKCLINTHVSACISSLVWLSLCYRQNGRLSLLDVLNGVLAGLSGITPASGFVDPQSAICIGILVGVLSYYSAKYVKSLDVDDVCDCFSLQAVTGTTGCLMISVLGQEMYLPNRNGDSYHRVLFFFIQLMGSLVVWIWSAFWTYLLIYYVDKYIGANISVSDEHQGLDKAELDEQAYQSSDGVVFTDDKDQAQQFMTYCANKKLNDVKKLYLEFGSVNYTNFDKKTGLHIAAQKDNIDLAKFLIKKGVSINAKDKYGHTAIYDAVQFQNLNMIKYLKEEGAISNYQSMLAQYFFCVATNSIHKMECLHEFGIPVDVSDYDKRTGLHIAVQNNLIEMVTYFLDVGANPFLNDRWNLSPNDYAVNANQTTIIQLISEVKQDQFEKPLRRKSQQIKKGSIQFNNSLIFKNIISKTFQDIQIQTNELLEAVQENNISEVQRLFKKGCSVNVQDEHKRTPLHIAASNNQMKMVELLLKQKDIVVNPIDEWQRTPYHEAYLHGHQEMAELLRNHQGIIIQPEIGYYLCQAGFEGDIASLKKLSGGGAQLDTGDYDLRTALHLAACENHLETVKWLVEQGVSQNVEDIFKNKPIDDARRYGFTKITQYLESQRDKF